MIGIGGRGMLMRFSGGIEGQRRWWGFSLASQVAGLGTEELRAQWTRYCDSALLESVGLKLSSATFIARYLSSESLPHLIVKVRFLKDMLVSSRTHEELIGRNAWRMMKHLSISIDDDIQRTSSFFEKIGVTGESFRTLLLLFPPIFLYDTENDIKLRIRALEKMSMIMFTYLAGDGETMHGHVPNNVHVDCHVDKAVITVRGRWRVHCVMGSRSCNCRLVDSTSDQGTVTTLLEENGIVKGVSYKTGAGEERKAYAPLTVVCDGCFSNLRRTLCTPMFIEKLGLNEEVIGVVREMGIEFPTEIQCIGIPVVLDGSSVVLGSHTGSGKTLAYMLPLVQHIKAIITAEELVSLRDPYEDNVIPIAEELRRRLPLSNTVKQ